MRYLITGHQSNLFARNGLLILEELFNPEEIEKLFSALKELPARDPFRTDPQIIKIACSRKITEVACELFKKKPLLLAFMHYGEVLPEQTSFSGLAGLLFIPEGKTEGHFLSETAPLPLEKGLLIGVGTLKTRYVHSETDPDTNWLKKLGFGFGDKIKIETHPIIAR